MKKNNLFSTNRRWFLGVLAVGATTLGLRGLASPLTTKQKKINPEPSDLEAWFNSLNGKHKMVFDAVSTNDGLPIVYTFNFMSTNNQTGTPDDQLSAPRGFSQQGDISCIE